MKKRVDEKGFTLLELLVAIPIVVFVVGASSMAIITLMRVGPSSTNWAYALRQVQNAGYWISRDAQMSQGTITVGDGNPTFLTMTVPQDANPAHNKQIVYDFQDIASLSSGLKLVRNDGNTIMIAEYISIPTSPVYNSGNRTLTFTIRATSGNVPVTKTYEATQRVPAATP